MSATTWIGLVLLWTGTVVSGMALASRRESWRPIWQGTVALGLGALFVAWTRGELVLAGMRGIVAAYVFFAMLFAWYRSLVQGLGDVFSLLVVLPGTASVAFAVLAPSWARSASSGASHSFHVVCTALAFAGLTLAFSAAWIVFLQLRVLKEKRLGFWWDRLPSLEAVDRFEYVSLRLAFLALGGMVLSGLLRRAAPGFAVPAPRLFGGAVLWGLVGLAMHARAVMKTSTRRLAWTSLALFGIALVLGLLLASQAQVPVRW